jgi:hypothetical protein
MHGESAVAFNWLGKSRFLASTRPFLDAASPGIMGHGSFLRNPLLVGEQPQDAFNRNAQPGGPVGKLVSDLVKGFFEYEQVERFP